MLLWSWSVLWWLCSLDSWAFDIRLCFVCWWIVCFTGKERKWSEKRLGKVLVESCLYVSLLDEERLNVLVWKRKKNEGEKREVERLGLKELGYCCVCVLCVIIYHCQILCMRALPPYDESTSWTVDSSILRLPWSLPSVRMCICLIPPVCYGIPLCFFENRFPCMLILFILSCISIQVILHIMLYFAT